LTYAGPEEVEGKPLQRINIGVRAKIVPKEAGGAMQIAIKDQKAEGALYFDAAAGRLSHSLLVQDMTLQIKTGDRTIDQRIEQAVKMRITPATQ
jgi:hypothetical protein